VYKVTFRSVILRLKVHPQQQVLEARVVTEGVNLVGRHQLFEFLEPVEDDVDGGFSLSAHLT